jgi:hypothetical protein
MFGLTRWSPFEDVFNFQKEVDRVFNQFERSADPDGRRFVAIIIPSEHDRRRLENRPAHARHRSEGRHP